MFTKLFEVKDTRTNGKGLSAKCFIPKGTVMFFECDSCRSITEEEFCSNLTIDEKGPYS
jgi:hypothetical protein